MSMERLIYFAPVLGICALLFAFYLTKKVGKQDAGTDRMKEIAAFIHEGARAFLTAEYKILVVFVAVLFVLMKKKLLLIRSMKSLYRFKMTLMILLNRWSRVILHMQIC